MSATANMTALEQRQAEALAQHRQRHKSASNPADPQAAPNNPRPKADRAARDKARRRFATFNTFVDSVGRYLPSSDREVWVVLYRFADAATNECEVRLADIGCRLGRHARTVARSIDRLAAAGLIERLKRGTRQGGPSRYRIDPEPAQHVERLRAAADRGNRDAGHRSHRERPQPVRSPTGQFTT